MKGIKMICLMVGLVWSIGIWAIPAYQGGIVHRQANGEDIVVYMHGDEFFHWLTNEAGETIELGADGNYHVVAAMTDEIVRARRAASPLKRQKNESTAFPLNLAPHGLVILVNSSDKAFTTPKSEMVEMLCGTNYRRSYTVGGMQIESEGSARQYFIDQSRGNYQPTFDVVGPYTASKKMSYYGENTTYGSEDHAHEIIIEACQLADADGVDFSLYDNNNDGEIDFVFVIYAGYGEADGGSVNTIWPHTAWVYDIYRKNVWLDNKRLNTYACGCEMSYQTKQHDGIGTFCHEFSHVLGLRDHYTTNNASHKTMGEWDLMDMGPYNNYSNTPPAYSAYERFFLGWLQPTQISGNMNVRLPELNKSFGACLIAQEPHNLVGNDPNPSTFYMIENRQQVGWDKYIPGNGMMLTRIKYDYYVWNSNTVNNASYDMGYDIIEADGKEPTRYANGWLGKQGDLFPSTNNKGEVVDYYLKIVNHEIYDIRIENDEVTFRLNNGGEEILLGVEDVADETTGSGCKKYMEDGQMVIEVDGVKYNVLGSKL